MREGARLGVASGERETRDRRGYFRVRVVVA
jgi:hypothetical protein